MTVLIIVKWKIMKLFCIQINLINLHRSNTIKNYLQFLTKRLSPSEDT